jgi:hypothetical protein
MVQHIKLFGGRLPRFRYVHDLKKDRHRRKTQQSNPTFKQYPRPRYIRKYSTYKYTPPQVETSPWLNPSMSLPYLILVLLLLLLLVFRSLHHLEGHFVCEFQKEMVDNCCFNIIPIHILATFTLFSDGHLVIFFLLVLSYKKVLIFWRYCVPHHIHFIEGNTATWLSWIGNRGLSK